MIVKTENVKTGNSEGERMDVSKFGIIGRSGGLQAFLSALRLFKVLKTLPLRSAAQSGWNECEQGLKV